MWTVFAEAEISISVTAVITSVCGLILTVLNLYWTKGSAARIAEAKANAEIAAVDAAKLKVEYERRIADLERESKEQIDRISTHARDRIAELQAHVNLVDKKLDESEKRERECLARAAKMEGKLEVLERKANLVSDKVEALERQPHDPKLVVEVHDSEAIQYATNEIKQSNRDVVHDVVDRLGGKLTKIEADVAEAIKKKDK